MAGRYDFTVEQGAKFSKTLTFKDSSGAVIDLSSWTGKRGQIRRYHRSEDVDATFTVAFSTDGTDGKLVISLTPAQTAALTAGETEGDARSQYVYDIEIYKGTEGSETDVKRVLEGNIFVDPEVTRPIT